MGGLQVKDKGAGAEKQQLRLELLFNFALLVIMLVFLIMSRAYPPAARAMPYVVMVPLALLILLQVFNVVKRYRALQTPDEKDAIGVFIKGITSEKSKKNYYMIITLIGLIVLIKLIGLVYGIGIYLIVFLKLISGEPWKTSIMIGVIIPAVIYVLFQVLLHIVLYPGIIWRYF